MLDVLGGLSSAEMDRFDLESFRAGGFVLVSCGSMDGTLPFSWKAIWGVEAWESDFVSDGDDLGPEKKSRSFDDFFSGSTPSHVDRGVGPGLGSKATGMKKLSESAVLPSMLGAPIMEECRLLRLEAGRLKPSFELDSGAGLSGDLAGLELLLDDESL